MAESPLCPSCAAGERNDDARIFRQRCEDLRLQLEAQQEAAAQKARDYDRIMSRKAAQWAQERSLLEAQLKTAQAGAAEAVKLRQLNTQLAVQMRGLTAATKMLCLQLESDSATGVVQTRPKTRT